VSAGRAQAEVPATLVHSILERTSGSPCLKAQDLLVPWVDEELDEIQSGLLYSHLETCNGCRALSLELTRMREELPVLATADPGPGFTERVLKATSLRALSTPSSSPSRLTAWWQQLVRRPAFAFESAYLGALLGLAIAGLFAGWTDDPYKLVSSAAGVTDRQVAALAESSSERLLRLKAYGEERLDDLTELRNRLQSRTADTWDRTVTEATAWGERQYTEWSASVSFAVAETGGTLNRLLKEPDATPPPTNGEPFSGPVR